MNRLSKLMTLIAALACCVHPADAQDGAKETGAKQAAATGAAVLCPVSGEAANLAVSTETEEGPVFFCCKNCVGGFKKEPAKYAQQVAAQRKALEGREKVQVMCPVGREPVDSKVFVERDGKKVHFCCDKCKGKYEAEPAKYAAALANSYTYQTLCPVMGKPIGAKDAVKLPTGETIYVCCGRCGPKLAADPVKYAPALAAQGIRIEGAKEPEKKAEGEKGAG